SSPGPPRLAAAVQQQHGRVVRRPVGVGHQFEACEALERDGRGGRPGIQRFVGHGRLCLPKRTSANATSKMIRYHKGGGRAGKPAWTPYARRGTAPTQSWAAQNRGFWPRIRPCDALAGCN